jgi:multidrug efflux pump subunit AcrB
VPLRELVRAEDGGRTQASITRTCQRGDLRDRRLAGAIESPVYAMLALQPALDAIDAARGLRHRAADAEQPSDTSRYTVKWDGEWHITYEVFRDLGLAFAVVLVLIYVLVWRGSSRS